MSNLDPGWLAVAQIYATLAAATAQNHSVSAVKRSREYEEMTKTALTAAGVEG